MSTFDRIEAGLPRLLADIADPRTPDYVDNVLGRTAGARQRPGWTFPERWLPMSVVALTSTRRQVPRLAILLVLLAIVLATGALLIGTSRPVQPLPAPFGPAVPGLVIYDEGGDILAVDPATGATSTLVEGGAADHAPRWSPDGSRFAFRRVASSDSVDVMVANADGSGAAAATAEPIKGVIDQLFSPDGRHLLITSAADGDQVITIVDLSDRSTRVLRDDDSVSLPAFRPPTGDEFVFVTGIRWSTQGQGLAVYDMATGTVRTILDPIPGAEIVGRPDYSPDGTRLAYALWVPEHEINSHIVIANADGSDPRPLPQPPGLCCEAAPVWSNDGTRLALTRWYDPSGENVAVVPWDEGGTGLEFAVPGLFRGVISWSPDDEWLLVARQRDEYGFDRDPQVVLDLSTGKTRDIGWTTVSDPSIQRLAR